MDILVKIDNWVAQQKEAGKTPEQLDRTFFVLEEEKVAELRLKKNGCFEVALHSKPFVVNYRAEEENSLAVDSLAYQRQQLLAMNEKANHKHKGQSYFLPHNTLVGNGEESLMKCKVKSIDLKENSVEVVYKSLDGEEMWAVLSVDTFDKHAKKG